MLTESVPVLIVGGGPTGLVLSMLLSRLGVDSRVVERDPSTCDHPRAHVVNTRSMEILRSFGLDGAILGEALDPMAAGSVRWVTSIAGRELAHLNLIPRGDALAARRAASPTIPASCAQDRVEPILAAKASEGRGSIHFATEMVELKQDAEGVDATLVHAGVESQIRAKWVVACDGASSPTRRLLEIPMEGPEALGRVIGIYFHADLSQWTDARPGMLYWTIDAQSPGTFIALDGRERWALHVGWDRERVALDEFTPQRCEEIARRAIGADVPVDVRSVRPWTMTGQVAETYRRGRVLLAGDAAHRFPPTGGFGMNTGIQDAHNLAWKLAWLLQGRAGESLVDSYEIERRPVARSNSDWSLRNALGLAEILGPGAAHQGQRLESGAVSFEALSGEIQKIVEREIGHFSALGRDLGFSYEQGALVADGTEPPTVEHKDRDYAPSARPGARAPHLWLERADQPLSTLDLFDDRFTLLSVADQTDIWRSAAASLPVPVTTVAIGSDVVDPSGSWSELYGVQDGAVLVRPDGHVAWRTSSRTGDPETDLGSALRSVLSLP